EHLERIVDEQEAEQVGIEGKWQQRQGRKQRYGRRNFEVTLGESRSSRTIETQVRGHRLRRRPTDFVSRSRITSRSRRRSEGFYVLYVFICEDASLRRLNTNATTRWRALGVVTLRNAMCAADRDISRRTITRTKWREIHSASSRLS